MDNTYQTKNAESTAELGMNTNTYLMLMHLSQLAGFFMVGLGFAIPIIMWAVNKDRSEEVDRHGKNIFNFMISYLLYAFGLAVAGVILTIGIITIPIALVCFLLFCVVPLLQIIFLIIATVKANSGEYWEYPMVIPFFYIKS